MTKILVVAGDGISPTAAMIDRLKLALDRVGQSTVIVRGGAMYGKTLAQHLLGRALVLDEPPKMPDALWFDECTELPSQFGPKQDRSRLVFHQIDYCSPAGLKSLFTR